LFDLLTATISPWALLLWYLDLPTESALLGEKLGQNRGRGHQILSPNMFLLFGAPTFVQNTNKNCDHMSADRQKDASGFTIYPMLCYSNNDNNNNNINNPDNVCGDGFIAISRAIVRVQLVQVYTLFLCPCQHRILIGTVSQEISFLANE